MTPSTDSSGRVLPSVPGTRSRNGISGSVCGMVLLSAAPQQWALSDICSKKPSLESVYVESFNPLTGRPSVELNPAGEFFFQQFAAIAKSAVDLHTNPALRATSLLADYACPPAADASAGPMYSHVCT